MMIVMVSLQSEQPSFEESWHSMQKFYNALCLALAPYEHQEQYCHPHWHATRYAIQQILHQAANPAFLLNHPIASCMLRRGFERPQEIELCFLQHCIKPSTAYLLTKVTDPDFGGIPKECRALHCTSNTLGQVYYFARIMDTMTKLPSIIIEMGGGFGALSRIFKEALPDVTIFIIDLPEMLAIQWLYLSRTLKDVPLEVHSAMPSQFCPGSIHLIPAMLLDQFNIKADLFVSNFALSECPENVQKKVIAKKFFSADFCYISGQLNGWTKELSFVHHNLIMKAIAQHYPTYSCQPFHIFDPAYMSYELIASR